MTDQKHKLIDLIAEFDDAMLVSRRTDGSLDARPMHVAKASEAGEIWFASGRSSGKNAEIQADPNVSVTFQSKKQYVTLSGTAAIITDRSVVQSMWKEPWKVWFPGGPDDPEVTLIKVTPQRGEYWDNAGTEGLKYLVKAGVAYLSGDRPELGDDVNAKVSL